MSLRVVVLAAPQMYREVLAWQLAREKDFNVIATAATADDAIAIAKSNDADLLLVDSGCLGQHNGSLSSLCAANDSGIETVIIGSCSLQSGNCRTIPADCGIQALIEQLRPMCNLPPARTQPLDISA